jgi:hypothetical protein
MWRVDTKKVHLLVLSEETVSITERYGLGHTIRSSGEDGERHIGIKGYNTSMYVYVHIQCIRKIAVHLGYGT